jgi:hypothetical protein
MLTGSNSRPGNTVKVVRTSRYPLRLPIAV